MRNDDDYYYDFSDYRTSDRIEAADIKECKNGMRTVILLHVLGLQGSRGPPIRWGVYMSVAQWEASVYGVDPLGYNSLLQPELLGPPDFGFMGR